MTTRILHSILACALAAFGIMILHASHLVTGGTTGLALNINYMTGMSFSIIFFMTNLPFYILSILRMGWGFTIASILSVTLLSFMTEAEKWVPQIELHPLLGAVSGGVAVGLALSIMFMNRTSLGGVSILAVYLQKRYNWDPGKVTLCFDVVIVTLSVVSIGIINALYSILSIIVISTIISAFKKKIAHQYKPVPVENRRVEVSA